MSKTKTDVQGHAVTLPNGQKRIDFIRDNYYDAKTHAHTDKCMSRSAIKEAINKMLPEGEQIPYQIVFQATKLAEDPRVATKARTEERAAAKKAKEAEKKPEKSEKKPAAQGPVAVPNKAKAGK